MTRKQHLDLLKQSVESWNRWRDSNPKVRPNLIGADLEDVNLSGANLSGANLTRAKLNHADLSGANLNGANLSEAKLGSTKLSKANLSDAMLVRAYLIDANLREANLEDADLSYADLKDADLTDAYLSGAEFIESDLTDADLTRADLSISDLTRADLSRADLRGAVLRQAILRETDLSETDLTNARLIETRIQKSNLKGCRIYGISAWGLKLDEVTQLDLIITPYNEPTITVDNLEVAQFIYLLLNNERIRHVIDTITSKVVLILGRFTPERKAVLDAIREHLRQRNYLPVLFDFEKPTSRDITETVSTLAHMARFVIADITDAKSIPQELDRIVPGLPSLPIQPLLIASDNEYGMFEHFKRYPWVLEPYIYDDTEGLIAELDEKVISPAEAKAKELAGK